MGKLVCFLKRKGGAGSSTLAANIAGDMAARGLQVRLLDCDPQRSLVSWAGLGDDGVLRDLVQEVSTQQGSEFRALLEQHLVEADRVVVDAAPGFDALALQAASLADVVAIPVRPSPLDFAAALDALEVAVLGVRGRPGARIAFVPSANLPRTRLGKELPAQLEAEGKPHDAIVLPSTTNRIVVAEAALSGNIVREVEPDGAAAAEFAALTDAVEALL